MNNGTRLHMFDAIRMEHGAFLEAILWRLTGDRELFAEALQESLLQIWRHAEQMQGPSGRGYLYRIAQSAASQAWRQRMMADGQGLEERGRPGEAPDDNAADHEMLAVVRRAISELPEQQNRAITMKYLEQKDYPAMAREAGCSEATMRSHVSKALTALRRRLNRPREACSKELRS